jgi:serine/threonine-protein kinase
VQTPSSLTWVGQRVAGRYLVEHQIAKGGMGRVFLATQEPLGRKVALKVLETRHDEADPAIGEARFVKEAAALARLQHPNTVRILDYGIWQGRLYLVMEYVDGPDLRQIFREETRLPAARVLALGKQIAGSLAEAHQLGIVHRDLKPSNILVTRRGRHEQAKVVDFGLAKEIAPHDPVTGSDHVLGTPRYMSPEQIRGEAIDGRADLYALGILLYRGLTGQVPFTQRQAAPLLHAHLREAPPTFAEVDPALDLPPAVEWVVQTCLAKAVEDRFADAWELTVALDAALAVLRDPALRDAVPTLEAGCTAVPFVVHTATPSDAPPVAARRSGWLVPVVAVVVLGALLLGMGAATTAAWWALGAGAPAWDLNGDPGPSP